MRSLLVMPEMYTSRRGVVFFMSGSHYRKELTMATTRRPQINHRQCDHAATPKARKACRKAHRTAEQQVVVTPQPNIFESKTGNTHALAYLVDGTPVPACSRRVTKGEAVYYAHGVYVCHRCTGVAVENRGR